MESGGIIRRAKSALGLTASAPLEVRQAAAATKPKSAPTPTAPDTISNTQDQASEPTPFKPKPLPAYTYFFVRGHPRSGTNWVGRLLNLHPQINCQGEYHFQIYQNALRSFCSRSHQIGSGKPVKPEARKATHDLIRRCMRATAEKKPQAMFLGDRTPSDLRQVLPNSRYFLVIRDGRDVLVSFTLHNLRGAGFQMDKEPFNTELAGMREQFTSNPGLFNDDPALLLSHEPWVRYAARSWAERAVSDREQASKITLNDGSQAVQEIRYESLHQDIERLRRGMYEFLQLDPDQALPTDQGEDTKPGLGRREDPSGLRRKGVVGDWARYFNDDVRRWFKEEAGETLVSLGYERDENW